MRDGIALARRNIAAAALVTEEFWSQGDFIAAAAGMPDIPRIELPHPVAGTGADSMASIASGVAPMILKSLSGATV